ncbi:hypothetical protein [Paenibacillus zanthoxyli]
MSKVKPANHAAPVAPTLEDLYLYHFQDEPTVGAGEEKEGA